jgi:hypothetical protein
MEDGVIKKFSGAGGRIAKAIPVSFCQVIQFLDVYSLLFPSFQSNKVRVMEFVLSRTTRSERGLRGRRGVVSG